VRPLDEVREAVIAAIVNQRAMEKARVRAETLLADVTGGVEIATLAEDTGLELITLETATRTSAEIPANLRNRLFKMPVPAEGEPHFELVELTDGYAVVRLDSVSAGELTEEEAMKRENYKRRLDNTSASAEIWAFLRMLRAQSEIQIYEDRL
jgi:peptidyl-prolyl cis-trans isomerase D